MRIIFGLVLALGCANPAANPCASEGATYALRFTIASGDCGNLSEQLHEVGADAFLPTTKNVLCAVQELDGCTQRNKRCRGPTTDEVTCTSNSSMTFTRDGASAAGRLEVVCTGVESCFGSYLIGANRRDAGQSTKKN